MLDIVVLGFFYHAEYGKYGVICFYYSIIVHETVTTYIAAAEAVKFLL